MEGQPALPSLPPGNQQQAPWRLCFGAIPAVPSPVPTFACLAAWGNPLPFGPAVWGGALGVAPPEAQVCSHAMDRVAGGAQRSKGEQDGWRASWLGLRSAPRSNSAPPPSLFRASRLSHSKSHSGEGGQRAGGGALSQEPTPGTWAGSPGHTGATVISHGLSMTFVTFCPKQGPGFCFGTVF